MPDDLGISSEELDLLVSYVLSLRKDFVQELLASLELPKSGIKTDLRARLADALEADPSRLYRVIAFLDAREPWAKQQVELLQVPAGIAQAWARDPGRLREVLVGADGRAAELLDNPASLALPEE